MQFDEQLLNKIVLEVQRQLKEWQSDTIVVGVSNRHAHLCREDLNALFGAGHELTVLKELKQPGEFAAEEVVTITGPKGSIFNVRILGPVRNKTQVEISNTDSFVLGIKPPVRESGNVEGSPGIVLTGPKGSIKKDEGVIIARRHIHMPVEYAKTRGIKDGDCVCVRTLSGERQLVFGNVLARVSDRFALEMHIDLDEANAGGIKNGDRVRLVDCGIVAMG
ncbi:MAG: phosphate propanoyltransferase [Bacillota bacterium]